MHLAGARAALVAIITLLLVSILSAIDILFGRLEGATAGALRVALPCLIFIFLAYLVFEAKVVGLLFHLAGGGGQLQGDHWYYAPPPMSFVGTFSSPGSSVGRWLSSEEATAGGRDDAASPAAFETESEAEPSPPTRETTVRSPLRSLSPTSRSSSSSAEASNLTSDEDVEDDTSSIALPTRTSWEEEYQHLHLFTRRFGYAALQDEADERLSPGGGINKSHTESNR